MNTIYNRFNGFSIYNLYSDLKNNIDNENTRYHYESLNQS